jgi:hypothetical protein
MTGTYSSRQDFGATMAGYSAQMIRLHDAFPAMTGVNRTANSNLEIKFQGELHRAMGWRRDHQDRD